MSQSVQLIPFSNLILAFIPALIVVAIFYRWSLDFRDAFYAISRMLAQLLLVGYFLSLIFKSDQALIVLLVLLVMVSTSSWIALRTIKAKRKHLFLKALSAIVVAGGLTLVLISQGVLGLRPWYAPRILIPLAGMIFAQAMNSISLAAERMEAETARHVTYEKARGIALRASLIPITNSLFAVGLVSLPGMMTGQILSGVSPLIAVRYQIMVMCMVFGASGIASAFFLKLIKPREIDVVIRANK